MVALTLSPMVGVVNGISSDEEDETNMLSLSQSSIVEQLTAKNNVRYPFEIVYHDLYMASSFGQWSGHWSPEYGTWTYDCKISGAATATGKHGFPSQGMIEAAAFDIKVDTNKDNGYLSLIDHTNFVWSTPSSNPGMNKNQIASLLIDTVISILGNMGASLAWTAASTIIDAMGNGANKTSISGESIWYLWQWNKNVNDVSQYMAFRADVKSNQTVTFIANYHIFGFGFELLTAGPMKFTITAPGSEIQSNPSLMTLDEREQYGIQTVSHEQLPSYLNTMKLSDDTVNELMSSDADEFYFTTTEPSIEIAQIDYEQELSSTLTKELLMEAIEYQSDRSKMIIDVFSDGANSNLDESKAIVKKHTLLLTKLNDLNDMIIEKNSVDEKTLNSAYVKYISVMNGNC